VDWTGGDVRGHFEAELGFRTANREVPSREPRRALVRRVRHEHAKERPIYAKCPLGQLTGAGTLVADRSTAGLVEQLSDQPFLDLVSFRERPGHYVCGQRRHSTLCAA